MKGGKKRKIHWSSLPAEAKKTGTRDKILAVYPGDFRTFCSVNWQSKSRNEKIENLFIRRVISHRKKK